MGYEFEPIEIVRVDKEKTRRKFEDKELYNVYFELSCEPPISWVKFFNESRRFPRHSMWREAWVNGKYIVVRCCLDEVKKYHANDIKEDVKNANEKYNEHLSLKAEEEKKKKVEEEEEKRNIEEALGDIEF